MRIPASILVTLLTQTAAFAPVNNARHSTKLQASSDAPDLVVISPPGGIGEITSLSAAKSGASIKWFVVGSSPQLKLTADSLAEIEKSGGSIEFASADGKSLVYASEGDVNSATVAVNKWCVGAKAVVCTYDGAEEEEKRSNKLNTEEESGEKLIRSGVRVAAREAANAARNAVKVVALGSDEEMGNIVAEDKKGLFNLFGSNDSNVPETLAEAMGNVNVVRYGELFGASESSPESSPFVGGPRIDPAIRDMYTMRSIRIDPTISVSGNVLSSQGSKSNRLAVGLALTKIGLSNNLPNNPVDVALSSYSGSIAPTDDEWKAEFDRVFSLLSSPSGGANLFSAEFASVPNIKRLGEWMATKWAPAVLRSYDIAGIRVGARPVYAVQSSDDTVEVVWQELVNFNSVVSGKMIISITEKGMTASRGAGDPSAGFGSLSKKPLPGEDALVRSLGDAAAQAVEKGLAVKASAASEKPLVAKAVEPLVVAETPKAPEPAPTQPLSDAGPRSSGVRRSSERTRGTRKRTASSTEGEGSFE